MNDIVERLRHKHALYQTPAILDEAADEIERLQAEVSDLRFQARNLIVSVDKLAAERDALRAMTDITLPPLPSWAQYPDDDSIKDAIQDYARLAVEQDRAMRGK